MKTHLNLLNIHSDILDAQNHETYLEETFGSSNRLN